MGTVPFRVVVRLPFNPNEVWAQRYPAQAGLRGTTGLRVKGTIRSANKAAKTDAGFPFSGSLLGKRNRDYLLVVTQKMQKGARVAPGSLAEFELEPDLDERPAPTELTKVLRSDRSVLKWFDQLNFSMKKYIAETICEPKSAAARQRRAEQWAERMMLTMEGEQEIPPILKVAFRRHPQAQAGWESLTLNQRRIHLLGLFSCQSPEAREKRVESAVEEAVRAGVRKRGARTAIGTEE
jgi:uncharacterized protein YdeI (YjbR/CyaY-like superfamily)